MAFRVKFSRRARQDALDILEWLEEQQAGETGLRWYEGLESAIASLATMPGRCTLAFENRFLPFELRQLLYGSKRHRYRVLFMIEGETVIILRIRRPGQKPLLSH